MSDDKQGEKPDGFCPKTLETFLVQAEVALSGHGSLHVVLEHLNAGRAALALVGLKTLRRNPGEHAGLTEAVERMVYATICPYHREPLP